MTGEISRDDVINCRIGNLDIDVASRSVTIDGRNIRLTWSEFDLLWYLAMNTGRVVSRDELFTRLLGIEYNGLDRTIDVRVSRLRRKLETDPGTPKIIQSVRSEGYCFTVGPQAESSSEN
jgi:two-component system response regulator RstA